MHYDLRYTPFANVKNIVVHGTHDVVAHIVHTNGTFTLYEQGALWEGDTPVADVDSWLHGLWVWGNRTV